MLVKICTSGGDTLPLSPLLKCITHTSLCSHPLFGLHTHSTSITECQQVPFFSQGGIQLHLCFICTSMSDAILSGCPSAAICHMAATRNGILVGRFSLYCRTNNQQHQQPPQTSQTNITGGITFRAALAYPKLCSANNLGRIKATEVVCFN